MKQIKLLSIALLASFVFLNSCVSLKEVHEFSDSSLSGVKNYENLTLDFETVCSEHCRIDKLQELDLDFEDCDCSESSDADSVTLILYNTVKNYFDGLSKLSDNELTSYKTDELTTALTENDFGDIKIDKSQVESYSKISKILLKAFTDEYRKKKIAIYVQDAQDPLMILLDALNTNLSKNLVGKVKTFKGKLKSYYFDIKNDNSISDIDKRNSLKEYSQQLQTIELWEKEIKSYSKAINKIKEGHTDLAKNIKNIKEDEVRALLSQYATDIESIKSEINKLKNK